MRSACTLPKPDHPGGQLVVGGQKRRSIRLLGCGPAAPAAPPPQAMLQKDAETNRSRGYVLLSASSEKINAEMCDHSGSPQVFPA